MNWSEIFGMGAYNFHVWTSWGLSIGALIAIVIIAKRRNAKIKLQLARQIRRAQKLADQ